MRVWNVGWPFGRISKSKTVSRSWECGSPSTCQETRRILWNLQFHVHIHHSPSNVPSLSHVLPSYFCNIHFHIILPSTLWSSKWSLSVFPTITLSSVLFSPICATCPVHLFLNDWISLIIFGMKHKMLTATSSFSGPNTSAQYSVTSSVYVLSFSW